MIKLDDSSDLDWKVAQEYQSNSHSGWFERRETSESCIIKSWRKNQVWEGEKAYKDNFVQ